MLQLYQGAIRKGAVQLLTRMVAPSRAHRLDVNQDARGGYNTEAGGALQKFVSALEPHVNLGLCILEVQVGYHMVMGFLQKALLSHFWHQPDIFIE